MIPFISGNSFFRYPPLTHTDKMPADIYPQLLAFVPNPAVRPDFNIKWNNLAGLKELLT